MEIVVPREGYDTIDCDECKCGVDMVVAFERNEGGPGLWSEIWLCLKCLKEAVGLLEKQYKIEGE